MNVKSANNAEFQGFAKPSKAKSKSVNNAEFKLTSKAKTQAKPKKARGEKSLKYKLLALIHTDPFYKEIYAAGAWEDWLSVRFGVSSCKELNERELGNILDIFSGKCKDRDYVFRSGTLSKAQSLKIYAIMRERKFGVKGRESFIKRQIGEYKPIYLLTKDEASKIITGLERLQHTLQRKKGQSGGG